MVPYVPLHMAAADHDCILCKQEKGGLRVLLHIIGAFRLVLRAVLFDPEPVHRRMEHGCHMVDCRHTI